MNETATKATTEKGPLAVEAQRKEAVPARPLGEVKK